MGLVCLHSQPPLPEEDYPLDEDPDGEEPEELLATGPPTLPKEYMMSHMGRTIIPRASLDRSTPAGWTLNVDPNGAWVFTNEHSPEQVAWRSERSTCPQPSLKQKEWFYNSRMAASYNP